METVTTHYFCQGQAVGAAAVQYFPITDTQAVTNTGAWEWATVLINATVPAASTLTLTMQISHDGVTWFPVYIHNLTAAANKWILAANIALAANTIGAVMGVSCPAPYIRLGAISAGAATSTLTAVFVAIT